MSSTIFVTKKKIISSNPCSGELIFLEGKTHFETGKYTEIETTEQTKAKELFTLETLLRFSFCGKFKIEDTEACWEIYNVNGEGTKQKNGNLAKTEPGPCLSHYLRIFAENMRVPYSTINEITEIIRYINGYQNKYFFLKPCFADNGKQGIELAMTQDYGVSFGLG